MSDIIRELEERERELREMRRREADWDFINSLPPRVRSAVVLFIETGDLSSPRGCRALALRTSWTSSGGPGFGSPKAI